MMRKIFAILCALVSLATTANHHLSADEAMARVGLQNRWAKNMHRAPAATAENDLYYVFNCEGGGYIIASADDRARAILGRCDRGEWNPSAMPPAMRTWLSQMEEALAALSLTDEEAPSTSTTSRNKAAAVRVEPLLGDIVWGQGEPYFNECPAVGNAHSATGCAATAMAQIMRFHQWPAKGAGSNSYTSETLKFDISEDFSQTTYDWAHMKPAYIISSDGKNRYYTDTEAKAVARLMYHLGAASDMDYNTGASGTTEGPMIRAMLENFSYDKGMQIYYREYFTSPEWYALLQSEIDAKRPVLMNGYSISGGHAFVIDGYDTSMGEGYFHFNWGWNGMSNGYYSVDITDPGQQGTGGSLGGYSYNQNIFVGIQRPTGATTDAAPNVCVSAALRYQYGQLHYQVLNRGIGSFSGEIGYVIDNGSTKTFSSVDTYSAMGFRQGSGSKHVSIAAPTSAGVRYYLASRVNGVVKALPTSIGSTAALVSVLDRTTGSYNLVPEESGLAKLQNVEFKLQDGVAYAGTTVYFTIKVKNTGKKEYNGALYLSLTDIDEKGEEGYEDRATDNPLGVYVRPGETFTAQFPYFGTPAAGKYRARLLYNPRNGGGLEYIDGAELNIEVTPYQAPATKNPPVLKVLSQELSAATVEEGKMLTLKVKVNNTGGTDAVMSGGVIYEKKGSSPKAYMGEQLISFPLGESEWTFTGRVNVAPGEYRMLFGFDDAGWWELPNYNYMYFSVTENLNPDPDPDPDPNPNPNPDPDPDPDPNPDPDPTPQPGEDVVLTLNDVWAVHYSDPKFSSEGRYYYYFNYGNVDDENGFPWFIFNTYQSSNTSIAEGTYNITDGSLGQVVVLLNMADYNSYKAGELPHPQTTGSVTFTHKGENLWQMTYEGTDADGTKYLADATLELDPQPTTDTVDPFRPDNNPNPNPDPEPQTHEIDVNYCEVELWTNPAMCPIEGYYDYYFQFVKLEEGAIKANKWPFVDFDLYLPVKGSLKEGTYTFGEDFCNFALIQNNADEQAYENWDDNYGFVSGNVTIKQNADKTWTIDVTTYTLDGETYHFSHTSEINLRWRDEDPFDNPGINDTFNKEPIETSNFCVGFNSIETSDNFIADYGFLYINLESDDINSEGENFVSEMYFRTKEPTLPAGTYSFSYDDEVDGTFVSSHGDSPTGGQYPSYIGLWNGTRMGDRWYITSGTIKVSYGPDEELYLTGDVVSHYGSKIRFSNDPVEIANGVPAIKVNGVKAGKFLEKNGQVRVHRDGRIYNLRGQHIR